MLKTRQRTGADLGFTPRHVSGLAVWLAAKRLTGLANDDPVASWPSYATETARDFTAAGTARPTFKTTQTPRGGPAILFDGVANVLHSAVPPTSQQVGSVVAVVKLTDVTAGTRDIFATYDVAGSTRFLTPLRQSGAQLFCQQRNADTVDSVNTPASSLAADTWYLLETHSNGSAYEIVINGVTQTLSVGSGTNSGDWSADVTGLDNCTVGASVASFPWGFGFKGMVAELVAWNGVTLNTYQRRGLRRYVRRAHGIAAG